MPDTINGHKVFLSYSRKDAGLVRKIELIVQAAGARPWRDETAIPPGKPWRPEITRSIGDCDRLMVFWCRHSRGSTEVAREYRQAMREAKTVVPVRLDRSSLASDLGRYQAIDISNLIWWSHEIIRWERMSLLAGIVLLLLGGAYALL